MILIIIAFEKNHTWVLKLWQDKKKIQDMEVLVINHLEVPAENQDMKIFHDLETQHHTNYIVKPLA